MYTLLNKFLEENNNFLVRVLAVITCKFCLVVNSE